MDACIFVETQDDKPHDPADKIIGEDSGFEELAVSSKRETQPVTQAETIEPQSENQAQGSEALGSRGKPTSGSR